MFASAFFSSKPSSAKENNVECEIEYKSSEKGMVTFYLDFESKSNLSMSNLTFELVSCE